MRSVYAVQNCEENLTFLGEVAERDIPFDPAPVGRYNVARETRALLLNERSSQLHLDPVHWGYAPEWWSKPALIRLLPEAECSGYSGSTDGPLFLLTAGSNRCSKTALNSRFYLP